jgi:transcriptional regulator with XRE-family HTH domain
MRRRSKQEKPTPMIREIVARNVAGLRDARFPQATNKNKALAEKAGISLSQVQRILSKNLGTSIDNVEWLAGVFGVRPQDLLTPYFSDNFEQRVTPPDSVTDGDGRHKAPLRRS